MVASKEFRVQGPLTFGDFAWLFWVVCVFAGAWVWVVVTYHPKRLLGIDPWGDFWPKIR